MRTLLTVLFILGLSVARADELEYTISGAIVNSPTPSMMTLQFIIDTTSGQQNFVFGSTTLNHFDASSMTLTDISLVAGGQTILSGATATDGAWFSDKVGGLYSTSFGFNVGSTGVGFTMDAAPGINAPSSDTFKSLMLGFTLFGGDGGGVMSPTQTIDWDPSSFSIKDVTVSVPEPNTLALMLLGFGGVLLASRLSLVKRSH